MKSLFNILVFLLLVFVSLELKSQNRKEKIESMKVAFIARELNLKPEEAKLFWPIYNEWQDKLNTLKIKRKDFKKIKDNPELASEKELEDCLNNEIYMKQKEVEFYKEFTEKFKKVITAKKVVLLHKAEEDFKRELIKQIKLKENKSSFD